MARRARRKAWEEQREWRGANPQYALLDDFKRLLPRWQPELHALVTNLPYSGANQTVRYLTNYCQTGQSSDGDLDKRFRDALEAAIIEARGTSERPPWACTWPANDPVLPARRSVVGGGCYDPMVGDRLRWWADAEREAFTSWGETMQMPFKPFLWDGSWCGKPSRDKPLRWTKFSFGARRQQLLLDFMRYCMPPQATAVECVAIKEAPECGIAGTIGEENAMLRAESEYAHHWRRCFGQPPLACAPQPAASQLPELASGAHKWASDVLRQMHAGERRMLPVVDGTWCCDYGVQTGLHLEMLEPRWEHRTVEVEYRYGRRVMNGDYSNTGMAGDYSRPVVRVKLHLVPRLVTRGSHCAMEIGIRSKWDSLKSMEEPDATQILCDCRGATSYLTVQRRKGEHARQLQAKRLRESQERDAMAEVKQVMMRLIYKVEHMASPPPPIATATVGKRPLSARSF